MFFRGHASPVRWPRPWASYAPAIRRSAGLSGIDVALETATEPLDAVDGNDNGSAIEGPPLSTGVRPESTAYSHLTAAAAAAASAVGARGQQHEAFAQGSRSATATAVPATAAAALPATGAKAARPTQSIEEEHTISALELSPPQPTQCRQSFTVRMGDASTLLLSGAARTSDGDSTPYAAAEAVSSEGSGKPLVVGGWDFIDVDPFGSCLPFLEAAVAGANDGGVLAIAATDLTVLCGKKGHKVSVPRTYYETDHVLDRLTVDPLSCRCKILII